VLKLLVLLPAVALLACTTIQSSPAGAAAARQDAALIPREALLGDPNVLDPIISPDGKRIAWLGRDGVGNMQIHVRHLGAAQAELVTKETNPITYDRRYRLSAYHRAMSWAQDSRTLFFTEITTSGVQPSALDVMSGEVRAITAAGKPAIVVRTSPSKPDSVLVIVGDLIGGDLYELNLKTGESTLREKNPGGVVFFGFVADDNFEVRALTVFPESGGTILRYRPSTSAPFVDLLMSDRFEGSAVYSLHENETTGKEEVIARSNVDGDKLVLVAIDPETKTRKILASDDKVDVHFVVVNPSTGAPEAVSFIRDRDEWTVLGGIGEDVRALTAAGRGDFYILSRDNADELWTVAFTRPEGVTYGVYQRSRRSLIANFAARTTLADWRLPTREPVSIPAGPYRTLKGYLTRPAGATGKLPLVLLAPQFGYPYLGNIDSYGFDSEAAWLAARGYAVLQVNVAGSDGYGNQWRAARGDNSNGAMDYVTARDWAVAQGIADAKRVGAFGASGFGNTTTLKLAVTKPGVLACAAIYTLPKMDDAFVLQASKLGLPVFVGAPTFKVDGFAKFQSAVAAGGGTLSGVEYDGASSNLRRLASRYYLDLTARVEAFFGKCLGGSVEPYAGAALPGAHPLLPSPEAGVQ
jgi:dipeptidyl aminopeptidase/acylaminoacyl peptidase